MRFRVGGKTDKKKRQDRAGKHLILQAEKTKTAHKPYLPSSLKLKPTELLKKGSRLSRLCKRREKFPGKGLTHCTRTKKAAIQMTTGYRILKIQWRLFSVMEFP
jgi:hypothetical protein